MMTTIMLVRLRVVALHEIARVGNPHLLHVHVTTPAEPKSLEALHNHEL